MPESEEEQAAIMKAWTEWFGGLGSAIKDMGNPFTPMAKGVSGDGSISNGPVGTMATGYSIVQAESLDRAVDIAKAARSSRGELRSRCTRPSR
jgi:hypothetical protein